MTEPVTGRRWGLAVAGMVGFLSVAAATTVTPQIVGADTAVPGPVRPGEAAVGRVGSGLSCPLFAPAGVAINDRFGTSVGVDGDDIAIGSWLADEGELRDAGSVTVFEVAPDGTVIERQRLMARDPEPVANFGYSVDLDGDILAVGALSETGMVDGAPVPETGAVHVFERASSNQPWMPTARLVADDGATGDGFGYSLEVDAEAGVIVVGAHTDDVEVGDGLVTNAGSAYLFERASSGGWTQTAKLVDPAARPGDRAAHDVAISDRWVVVGHHLDDQVGERTVSNAGGALLYERTSDGIVGPLEVTGSMARPRDRAGIAVDVDGDLLVMSSWSQQPGDRSALWIFGYGRDGWREHARIDVTDPSPDGTEFGRHLVVDDGVIVVGAAGDGVGVPGGGAMHVFGAPDGTWRRVAHLAPDGVTEGAQAGISVGLGDRWAVMGAERSAVGARNGGGACVVSRSALVGDVSGPRGLADGTDAEAITVVVDAGERDPAPAAPLANGQTGQLTRGRVVTTLVLVAAGLAAVVGLVTLGLARVRAGAGPPRR